MIGSTIVSKGETNVVTDLSKDRCCVYVYDYAIVEGERDSTVSQSLEDALNTME